MKMKKKTYRLGDFVYCPVNGTVAEVVDVVERPRFFGIFGRTVTYCYRIAPVKEMENDDDCWRNLQRWVKNSEVYPISDDDFHFVLKMMYAAQPVVAAKG